MVLGQECQTEEVCSRMRFRLLKVKRKNTSYKKVYGSRWQMNEKQWDK